MLLFVVLPYVAFAIFVTGTIERYRSHAYSCSTFSSQFLENRLHFWGMVPFHFGLILVLVAHLLAFLLPAQVLAWNSRPLRLYILEGTGLALGLLTLAGFTVAIVRRVANPKLRAIAGVGDYLVYVLLVAQIATGVLIAIQYRWGSSWYAAVAAPYLWSLVLLKPDPALVAALPTAIQSHIVGAFALLLVFPFSRLVHVIDVPNSYLWRRPQVVRWYRRRAAPMEAKS